jgi:hypothetical protein
MPISGGMVEVKGTAVRVVSDYVQARYGAPGLQRWTERLSPGARGIFANPVYPNLWYPLDTAFLEPTAKVCELFQAGSRQGAVQIGRFSAERALRGIYKFLVKLGSPETLLERASSVFATYYRPCRMEAEMKAKKLAHLRITHFPGITGLIEARIEGWAARSLEISGCADVSARITDSLAAGGRFTQFELSWR